MSAVLSPVDAFGHALAGGPWRLALDDGAELAIPFERFTGEASPGEHRALARARGPVLDVGCGPGRHVRALARRGVLALGVDVSREAVRLAVARGTAAMLGSIFEDVPRAGAWRSALLLDGNLGIGGDPGRLLRRVGDLLAPDGAVIVECQAPAEARAGRSRVRLVGPAGASETFPWALVGRWELVGVARRAGFAVTEAWEDEGRSFATLVAGP